MLTLLFKHFKNPDYLEKHSMELFSLIKDSMNDSGKDVFLSLFLYFITITDSDEKELAKKMNTISQEGGEIAMSTYTRLLNQGREEGIIQGMMKGREEGIIQGILKGRQEGKQEGILEGVQKGKLEGLYSTARKMKLKNLDNQMIIEITGLSKEEIDAIQV